MLKKILNSLRCTFVGWVACVLFIGLLIFTPYLMGEMRLVDGWSFKNITSFAFIWALWGGMAGIAIFVWWILLFLPFIFWKKCIFFKKPLAPFWGILLCSAGFVFFFALITWGKSGYGAGWQKIGMIIGNCTPAAIVGAVSFHLYAKYLENIEKVN